MDRRTAEMSIQLTSNARNQIHGGEGEGKGEGKGEGDGDGDGEDDEAGAEQWLLPRAEEEDRWEADMWISRELDLFCSMFRRSRGSHVIVIAIPLSSMCSSMCTYTVGTRICTVSFFLAPSALLRRLLSLSGDGKYAYLLVGTE